MKSQEKNGIPGKNLLLERSMKIVIGFKATRKFKEFLQNIAKQENRSLSNFIVNALLTYIKEHHGTEYSEENQK